LGILELTMQYSPKRRKALSFAMALGLVAAMALAVQPANAQRARTAAVSTPTSIDPNVNPKPGARYFVDFRARTAASYGHAFVWYGRVGEKAVEVAGLHPATESVIPYIIGHVLPVPSETGASYGDLDEQYLTASYRIILNEAEAKQVFAYIKHLQATSPLWNAATYNCVAFISNIAQYMGLNVPSSTLLYPENWVNELRDNNGKNPKVKLAARSASVRGE
jgi:hypothetical protein